jgi:methyl-accepting chemotaxis protein
MRNIKIGARLSLGFGAMLALLSLVAGIGVTRMAADNHTINNIVEITYKKVMLATDMSVSSDISARNLRNAMLATTPETMETMLSRMSAASSESNSVFDKLSTVATAPAERALLTKIKDTQTKYVESRQTVIKLLQGGDKTAAVDYLFGAIIPVYNKYNDAVKDMVEFERKAMADESKVALEQSRSAELLLISASLAAVALGILFAILITRSITRPLSKAVTVAEAVANGDLTSTIHVTSKDETGQLLQALMHMNENLTKIVGEVRTGTDTISTAVNEIAAGNLDLSARTEQQAGSLEETASSMEEMTSTVKQNADNARQANRLAVAASDVAGRGGLVVSQVVGTMNSINESSKKVVDIVGVIDGIAFQTNILALNAAVEAARAGEEGRGFAVVAAEVRSLAQRSAAAAKEIKTLIDDSVGKVDAGAALVSQAGATMAEIITSIKQVTDIVGEITAASQEQTSGIEQINQAIAQMDQVTQQNAALVEEAAAASQSMAEQADKLSQAVSVFKLDNGPAAAGAGSATERRPQATPARTESRVRHVSVSRPSRRPTDADLAASGDWEQF